MPWKGSDSLSSRRHESTMTPVSTPQFVVIAAKLKVNEHLADPQGKLIMPYPGCWAHKGPLSSDLWKGLGHRLQESVAVWED